MKDIVKHLVRPWSAVYGSSPEETRFRLVSEAGGGSHWDTSDEPYAVSLVNPLHNEYIKTYNASGWVYLHECDSQTLRLYGVGGLTSSVIDILDYPEIIGHYWYRTKLAIVRDWFLESGAVPTMEDMLSVSYPRALEWLDTTGKAHADFYVRDIQNPLDADFSLPTFIRESREIVGLLRHIMGYKVLIKRVARHFRSLNLKQISRVLADEHLTWSFGFLPLVDDIKKLGTLLHTYEKILQELYRGRSRTFKYGSKDVTPFFPVVEFPLGDMIIGQYRGVGGSWFIRSTVKAEWKGYLRYYQRIGIDINSRRGSFLGLLEILGVTPDPGIFYDAIPFSFIVDWFTDLGDNLHAMEKHLVDVTMTLTGAAHHLRLQYSRVYYYMNPAAGNTPTAQFEEVSTAFVRRTYLPADTNGPTMLKKLGIRHLLLSASLARTRR